MNRFIEFNLVHLTNIEGDCLLSCDKDEIISVRSATDMDRRQRAAIGAIVECTGGNMFAVANDYKSIMTMLTKADYENTEPTN